MAVLSVFSDRAREQGVFYRCGQVGYYSKTGRANTARYCIELCRRATKWTRSRISYIARGQLHASAKRLKDAFAVTAKARGL